jgi:hypothetical protein
MRPAGGSIRAMCRLGLIVVRPPHDDSAGMSVTAIAGSRRDGRRALRPARRGAAGGSVGALASANAGARLAGIASNRLSMPPPAEVSHADVVFGAVGGLLGLAASYAYGVRKDREDGRRPSED